MTKLHRAFDSVLIANRGEIACRIIRTARNMGLRTIAVYSDADQFAPHVAAADDAIRIGPAPVNASYLLIDNIIAAAKKTNAGAIHPGYGFLSENAEFAQACQNANIIFVGPTPDAIELMGDKARAKRRMIDVGVPCIPGYQGDDQNDQTLKNEAGRIGFPVMVKAAAGGGGKGMRLVTQADQLSDALSTARSEAANAFGSGFLILEKAVMAPRHVEIQVLADSYGHTIHLGERDCSVQRRHQKVLEEAPSPVLDETLRRKMGEAAVKAAQDIGYVGAGTVEFLLDSNGEFYFLEMNTRLQVEHPVTELVTGLDLVEWQFRIASGDALSILQEDIEISGHAIEARLYAEDPANDFLPATGNIAYWQAADGVGVRVDAGVSTGSEVSPYYDPMIAKVIAHGPTRREARQRLTRALKNTKCFGLTTNRSFLIDALENSVFAAGEATTNFIEKHFPLSRSDHADLTSNAVLVASALLFRDAEAKMSARAIAPMVGLNGWSSATKIKSPYRLCYNDTAFDVTLTSLGANRYETQLGEKHAILEVDQQNEATAHCSINGENIITHFHCPVGAPVNSRIFISIDSRDFDIENLNAIPAASNEQAGEGAITAPMHGLLAELFVSKGQSVAKGDRLAILEAMKMQHEIFASIDGEIVSVDATAGDQVAAGAILIKIEAIADI